MLWEYVLDATARVLCRHLGSFKRMDHGDNFNEEGEYMRVRVGVNTLKLLVKKLVINCDYLDPCEVTLRYEKMNFCYFYGRLDHNDRDCDEKIECQGNEDPIDDMQ